MIFLFNTLSRKKEEFRPIAPPLVTMYNCGPTVYNYAHIGNLRGYVNADVLRRLLETHGYQVRQIINITDVGHLVEEGDDGEDKVEKGARREKKTVEEIIQFYADAFMNDLQSLNIDPKGIYKFPRATEHIKEQIDLIKILEEKGYTYTTSDGVYFDSTKYTDYGALAQLDMENLKEGARVETNPEKRHRTDFALWKFSGKEERLQEWESPWGIGFPGWHIECSAMSMKYLGETLDIHTGGIDHIPVHHTNERAQSVCATGKVFAHYWLHHEFVNIDGSKMAKSENNFIRLQTLIDKGFSPLDYRYLLLQAHYRTPITFSFESLDSSMRARERLIRNFKELESDSETVVNEKYKGEFLEALDDDLNTSLALATMWNVLKDENLSKGERAATLLFFDSLLGIGLKEAYEKSEQINIPEDILLLAQERQKEKNAKNYTKADVLRDEIKDRGYIVRDTKNGFEVGKE